VLLAACTAARADYFADVGYDTMREELGTSLPVAAGVPVMIVEAGKMTDAGVVTYAPDQLNAGFRGKKITVGEGGPRVYAPFSGHATGVGRRFFGLQLSVSPGIEQISSYLVDNWFGSAFLRLGEVRQPKVSSHRVVSHAWVGSAAKVAIDQANDSILRRVDWLVETDELFHVVGFNGGNKVPLLADAFNVLSVAHTGLDRHRNTLALGKDYIAGRARPHLVVPDKTPSASTGRVASVAALLVGVGHADPSLSHGSTTNRNGDKIYNAERAEIIKAALLAGADRVTRNTSGVDIEGYRADGSNRTANGLDRRYGAGQLNINNSYRILTAGEQDSAEDHASGGQIGPAGFDHDESFGGLGDSNRQATYRFSTGSVGGYLALALVWNIDIQGGGSLAFDPTATRYDLDMLLYEVSGDDLISMAESRSRRDNSENIHFLLAPERDYVFRIQPGARQEVFDWDYGVAWWFVEGNVVE
jgi:hypothetical protein